MAEGAAMSRPICVHCGKAYGQRKTIRECLVWPRGEPQPNTDNPGTHVRRDIIKMAPHSSTGTMFGKSYGPNDNVLLVDIWNGAWGSGTADPFCTLRCALDYARKRLRG